VEQTRFLCVYSYYQNKFAILDGELIWKFCFFLSVLRKCFS